MPIVADLYYSEHVGNEEGMKPPIVLIHGAGGTHLYWPSQIRRLPGYRVYALDLPGHGKSGRCGQQSIGGYAEILVEWLNGVGLPRAVWIGHSMGGAIAISLALDYPEHVLGLGLIGSGARLRVAPAFLENTANQTTFLSAVEMIVDYSFSQYASQQLTQLARKRMAETRPSVLHGDFMACNIFNETERISAIHQPALVICGEEDRMMPLRHAQYLASNIPNAVLKTIPKAGHMVMLEHPQAVATVIADFLRGMTV